MKFEFAVADLSQAISAAAKVASGKGDGLLLDWSAMDDRLVVAANNLASTYRQSIPMLSSEGHPTSARCQVPSAAFSTYVGRLPPEASVAVEITNAMSRQVIIQQGRSRATFNTIEAEYPQVPHYSDLDVLQVESLSKILKSVVFASSRSGPPLDGVHINGTAIGATDKHRAALADCKIPVEKPVTVPLRALAGTFTNDHVIGIASKDDRIVLVLDQDTQLTSQIYAVPYPNLDAAFDRAKSGMAGSSLVQKSDMLQCLQRINGLFGSEAFPTVEITAGVGTSIEMRSNIPDIGTVQEFCEHEIVTPFPEELVIGFNPKSLAELMNAATESTVTISWPGKTNGFLLASTENWQSVLATVKVQ